MSSKIRQIKEQKFKQKAKVIWLSGLSGSGKTTLAKLLDKELTSLGFVCVHLDGDEVRKGLNVDLGFSNTARFENIRRIAEVCKIFSTTGIISIASFISPTHLLRKLAKDIIGEEDFIEVFIDCPIGICSNRDVKGLYAKVKQGKLKDFTGIDADYEPPINPSITIHTDKMTVDKSTSILLEYIKPFISL